MSFLLKISLQIQTMAHFNSFVGLAHRITATEDTYTQTVLLKSKGGILNRYISMMPHHKIKMDCSDVKDPLNDLIFCTLKFQGCFCVSLLFSKQPPAAFVHIKISTDRRFKLAQYAYNILRLFFLTILAFSVKLLQYHNVVQPSGMKAKVQE